MSTGGLRPEQSNIVVNGDAAIWSNTAISGKWLINKWRHTHISWLQFFFFFESLFWDSLIALLVFSPVFKLSHFKSDPPYCHHKTIYVILKCSYSQSVPQGKYTVLENIPFFFTEQYVSHSISLVWYCGLFCRGNNPCRVSNIHLHHSKPIIGTCFSLWVSQEALGLQILGAFTWLQADFCSRACIP